MRNDRLTIFHINTQRTFRGGEVQTLLLARELCSRGHQNYIFAQKGSPLAERARKAGITTYEVAMHGEWDLLAARKLRKAIRTQSPDIVHAHTPHACSLALLGRGRKAAPAVIFSRRISSPLRKTAKYRMVDAILAVSPSILRNLLAAGFEDTKVFLAESATDFSALHHLLPRAEVRGHLGIPENAYVIGNVGHFDRYKGQGLLIRAFALLVRNNPNHPYFLLLVGEGPALPECRALSRKENCSHRIIFAGRRFDLQNMYASMDLFFLPSLPAAYEGWSGVLREAMGVGLPVIAVRQQSTEEQIQDGRTGLLVPANRLEEWIAAIERLCSDPEKAKSIGERGRTSALHYTPKALAEKTEFCYRETLLRLSRS